MIDKEIKIPIGNIVLKGNLVLPDEATSIIIFSHGSGSSRFSPRNNYVAQHLNSENIGTLLVDLLTSEEDDVYENRFNIDLLTERLIAVTEAIQIMPEAKDFHIGYFGASTGAASALKAAAKLGNQISTIVSRGGRPDMAGSDLPLIHSPVLLIVGSLDTQVIALNKTAFDQLKCNKELKIVNNATHLFEEPGKLEEVTKLASNWFKKHLQETSDISF